MSRLLIYFFVLFLFVGKHTISDSNRLGSLLSGYSGEKVEVRPFTVGSFTSGTVISCLHTQDFVFHFLFVEGRGRSNTKRGDSDRGSHD